MLLVMKEDKLSSAKDLLKVSFCIIWWLGGCKGFLTLDLEEGVIFHIIDHVGRGFRRYSESLMKICHDLVDWLHFGLGGC